MHPAPAKDEPDESATLPIDDSLIELALKAFAMFFATIRYG